jgi:hypothetical protein
MDRRALFGWSLRAVALAWPSAALAVMGSFTAASVLAMLVGTGAYALLFAHLSSRSRTKTGERHPLWSALEKAASVKAAWLFAALPAWGLVIVAELRGPVFLFPFFAAFVLDELTGAVSIALTTHLYETLGLAPALLHDSFPQTLLTTLFQGSFITLTLAPLTLAIHLHRTLQPNHRPFT